MLSPVVGHIAPGQLTLTYGSLARDDFSHREKADMGLCSSRSEQGTATQQSSPLFSKGLGSNLLFGINMKTPVNSFRAEIRGAQSQQRRDYGRLSDSMMPQIKNP